MIDGKDGRIGVIENIRLFHMYFEVVRKQAFVADGVVAVRALDEIFSVHGRVASVHLLVQLEVDLPHVGVWTVFAAMQFPEPTVLGQVTAFVDDVAPRAARNTADTAQRVSMVPRFAPCSLLRLLLLQVLWNVRRILGWGFIFLRIGIIDWARG